MTLKPGDRVTFKEMDFSLHHICIQAGTEARVIGVEEPCYWVELHGGGRVRVTEERVEKQERKPRRAGSAKGQIRMAEDFDEPLEEFREYLGEETDDSR